jgi:hypothetical protein
VVTFDAEGRPGRLTGRVATTADGRAEVVLGTLSGPINVRWHSTFPDSEVRTCDGEHTWSLRAL